MGEYNLEGKTREAFAVLWDILADERFLPKWGYELCLNPADPEYTSGFAEDGYVKEYKQLKYNHSSGFDLFFAFDNLTGKHTGKLRMNIPDAHKTEIDKRAGPVIKLLSSAYEPRK